MSWPAGHSMGVHFLGKLTVEDEKFSGTVPGGDGNTFWWGDKGDVVPGSRRRQPHAVNHRAAPSSSSLWESLAM